ncbi:MAG: hypothetical protein MJ016_04110 [Victivallaceae bacterium]|nr:hypothetical protein [Victivallaceae bacterium]
MSQNGDISKNNDEIIFRSESSIAGRWQLTPGKYFIWVKRGLKDKKTKKSIINVQINQTTFKDKFSDDEVEWEKIGNYTLKENFIRVIFEIESDGAVVIQDIILTPDSGFNPKKADLSSLPVLGEK